ncbi:hypothetical protein BZG02_02105 [Labilibaculum filiforme]|uniref:Uncharacterized protein n=1 Tax=Labilibaculum filiforme TaxID=1940526 RepID=A0A2N3I690_9BACT|nr:hypothetical protein [Labilibaculum filiforme]PKQ65819.1 hypothetical protein BZG02_02105 [Labilibaculum filiforme]
MENKLVLEVRDGNRNLNFWYKKPRNEELQLMTTTTSLIPAIRPQSNYKVTFGVIKIYIPNDGEPFDYGKVYLYRYWRNALASFDELIQDYRERNPYEMK